MIDNDVHIFGRKCPFVALSYHEYKDNWLEGSNFASASARGWRLTSLHPGLHLKSPLTHVQISIQKSSFTKNGDLICQSFPHHNFALYGI